MQLKTDKIFTCYTLYTKKVVFNYRKIVICCEVSFLVQEVSGIVTELDEIE